MKILISGGVTGTNKNQEEIVKEVAVFELVARTIVPRLLKNGHEVIVCSPFDDSIDYQVINAFSKQDAKDQNKLQIYYPDTPQITKNLNLLLKACGIGVAKKFPCKTVLTEDGSDNNQYSWLVAQLSALESCLGVITIGGKANGALSLLLKMAEAKSKFIIPLAYLGGATFDYFNENKWTIRDCISDGINVLFDIEQINQMPEIFERLTQGKSKQAAPKFFISYPRARPHEADYIETLLRRRGYLVYRDEETFEPAAETPQEIIRNIKDASVFIAIWCKEYACSPWCFDELEIGIDRFKDGLCELWIFSIDETRIVPKNARNMNYYHTETREELEGKVLFLLNKLTDSNQ